MSDSIVLSLALVVLVVLSICLVTLVRELRRIQKELSDISRGVSGVDARLKTVAESILSLKNEALRASSFLQPEEPR